MDEDVFDESKLFSEFDSVENGDESAALYTRAKSASLSELDSLKQENMLLKKLVRKIGFNPSVDEPFANILFYDSACSKQGDLEDFICHVARKSAQNNASKVSNESSRPSLARRNILSDGFAAALGRISDYTKLDYEELQYDMSYLPIGSVQYFASFCLDTFGSDMEKIFPNPPSYDRAYFKTLPEETGAKVSQKRKISCFNCDGDHRLNDCPKPRDFARIGMKRREFMGGKTFTSESRYHEDQMKLKQYQHLKPGIISNKLREALNMVDHDLPPFIYRMRMLGYPPGWLPGNHDSGIVMYGKEGQEEQSNESNHFDSDKYVHYPGFNVPVPQACKDLACEVRLPVMQHQYQLDVKSDVKSEDDWSENDNKKRKFSSDDMPYNESKRMRPSSENDMEVEDEEPPGSSSVIETDGPFRDNQANASSLAQTTTLPLSQSTELEDGEIADSPEYTDVVDQPSWWLKQPLVAHFKKETQVFMPPPFPLSPLPLHKISQILPGELNHISFEDRSRWLDPIFGNLQVRTGRFEKLKTILAARENKRKSL